MKRLLLVALFILSSVCLVLGQADKYYGLGETAMNQKNYPQAIKYFNICLGEARSLVLIDSCEAKISECNRLLKEQQEKAQREQEQRQQARREQEAIEAEQARREQEAIEAKQRKFILGESAMKKGNYDQAITLFTEAKKAAKDTGTVSLCNKMIAACNRLKKHREEANNRQKFSVQPKQSAPSSGYNNGHEWVDLGLSVKWATCNVGASSPSDYGNYYAWGETSTKSEYYLTNYVFRFSGSSYSDVKFSKYNTDSKYGSVDNRTRLSLSDDVARANWGGNWHMPTKEEFEELMSCTWKWTTEWGVNGYKVTSKKNGNSIFLPAAGYRDGSTVLDAGSIGFYWSSSLNTDFPYLAGRLSFNSSGFYTGLSSRGIGFSVRPVTE